MKLIRAWQVSLLVVIASFPLLYFEKAELFADFDTARDLLQAAACANGNSELCESSPPTWFARLAHGSLWIRFLALGYRLNLTVTAMHAITLAFIAIGAGVAAHTAHRHAGRAAALFTGGLFLSLSLWITQRHTFWNPTLLPLPVALFVWALLEHARRGRTRDAALASVSLALAIDLHLVCAVLAPILFVTTVASARRPVLALTTSFAAMGLALWLVSAGTWAHNLAAARETGLDWLLNFIPLGSAAIGLAARSHWLRLDSSRKAGLLLAAMALWAVVPVLAGKTPGRYFAPSLPAFAIGAGWICHLLTTPLPIMRIAILAGFVSHVRDGGSQNHEQWTLSEISRFASTFANSRVGGSELFSRLEGLPFATAASFAALTRPIHDDAIEGKENFLVVRADRSWLPSRAPDDWEVVDLRGTRAGVIRPIRPMLSRNPFRVCFRPLEAGSEADCVEAFHDARPKEHEYPPFSTVWSDFSENLLQANALGYRAEVWFDIDTNDIGPDHWLDVVDAEGDWRIEAVEGIAFQGSLPAKRVIIEAGSGKGKIALARDHRAGERPSPHWPPLIIETRADETELRRLYEQSLSLRPTSSRTTEPESPPRLRSPNSG